MPRETPLSHSRIEAAAAANVTIIRPKQLAKLLGFSRKHIQELSSSGQLPPKIVLGPNSVGWRLADIEQWIADRKEVK